MIAHRPTIEPTDRSMPPVMMMNVIGSAMQADLGHQAALIQQIVDGQEALVEKAEDRKRDHQNRRQQRLMTDKPARRGASGTSGARTAMAPILPPGGAGAAGCRR